MLAAGGTYSELCRNLLIRFHSRNYFPSSLALNSCLTDSILADIPTLVPFVFGPSAWDPRLKGRPYAEPNTNEIFDFPVTDTNSTASLFLEAYTAHPLWIEWFSSSLALPIYQAVGGYVCGYAIAETMRLATSFDPQTWLAAWYTLNMETVYGPIRLDSAGHNEAKEYLILQVNHQHTFEIAAPFSSANVEAIYPAPHWDERVFNSSPYSKVVEIPFLAIISLFVVLTLILMVMLFVWRQKPQILAASFLFCEIICLGSLFSYVSLYFWSIYTNTVFCNLHLWLLIIGFDLFLGALLVKNYKIQKIFHAAKRLKQTTIEDSSLFYATLSMLVFDVIVLAVWQIAFPIVVHLISPDPYRPALSYYRCVTTTRDLTAAFDPGLVESVFVGILGAYKLIQIAGGVVMAYRLRNTPTEFNEARYIGYVLYNLLLSIILHIVTWLAIPRKDYVLAYILRTIIAIWAITFSLLSIFVPKIYFILRKRELSPSGNTSKRDLDSFNLQSDTTSDTPPTRPSKKGRDYSTFPLPGLVIAGRTNLQAPFMTAFPQMEATMTLSR